MQSPSACCCMLIAPGPRGPRKTIVCAPSCAPCLRQVSKAREREDRKKGIRDIGTRTGIVNDVVTRARLQSCRNECFECFVTRARLQSCRNECFECFVTRARLQSCRNECFECFVTRARLQLPQRVL